MRLRLRRVCQCGMAGPSRTKQTRRAELAERAWAGKTDCSLSTPSSRHVHLARVYFRGHGCGETERCQRVIRAMCDEGRVWVLKVSHEIDCLLCHRRSVTRTRSLRCFSCLPMLPMLYPCIAWSAREPPLDSLSLRLIVHPSHVGGRRSSHTLIVRSPWPSGTHPCEHLPRLAPCPVNAVACVCPYNRLNATRYRE